MLFIVIGVVIKGFIVVYIISNIIMLKKMWVVVDWILKLIMYVSFDFMVSNGV